MTGAIPLVAACGLLLHACAPPGDQAWLDAREACGLAPGERPTGALVDDAPSRGLDRGCATWLGEDLGVDWESFGAEPGPVEDAQDALSMLLLGAHQLIAGDWGTVGRLLADPRAPAWGLQDLEGLADEIDLAGPDDAGALLYAHVLRHVDRVVYDPGLSQVGAWYHGGTVSLPTLHAAREAPPLWMATVLVHEASHARGPAHVACDSGEPAGCDPDLDGIYGTQGWALHAHVQALDPTDPLAAASCAEAQVDLSTVCRMVNEPGDAAVCDAMALARTCDDL